jgi:hypothetical protein
MWYSSSGVIRYGSSLCWPGPRIEPALPSSKLLVLKALLAADTLPVEKEGGQDSFQYRPASDVKLSLEHLADLHPSTVLLDLTKKPLYTK